MGTGLHRSRVTSLILAAMIALVFLSQGITAPFSKDQEPQSAQWLSDVAEHGRWLVAHDDYGCAMRKPPLYYWLSAIVVKATGGHVNEVNARLLSVLAGAAVAVATMAWCCTHLGAAEGWLAFFFLLGSYGFASRATEALTDMLLTFFLFLAYCVLYPQIEGSGSLKRAIAAGVLIGLGILTKGPVAIVLSALAVFIYLLMTRGRIRHELGRSWPWIVLGVAVAVSACWYVPAIVRGGSELTTIVLQENLGHFLPSNMGGTGEAARPFYYIVGRLFGGALPMSLLVFALIAALVEGKLSAAARKPILFQLGLVLAVLLLFSLASSKRDDYVLAAMPGLAIACASVFALRPSPSGGINYAARIADWTAAIVAAAAFLFVPLTLGFLHFEAEALSVRMQSSDAAYLSIFLERFRQMDSRLLVCLGFVALGAAAVLVALHRREPLASGGAIAILGLAGVALFVGTLRPELARARTLKEFAERAHRRIGEAPLYVPGAANYELSFYYGRALPPLSKKMLARQSIWSPPVYIVASARDLTGLAPAVCARLKLVIRGDNAGGGGPLSLYEFGPAEVPLVSVRRRRECCLRRLR
jgi:4-amino-4-deoxy-L-arabinose transferase-like glycosyltransferase